MGYAPTAIVVYGVKISDPVLAQRIYDFLMNQPSRSKNKDNEDECSLFVCDPKHVYHRKITSYDIQRGRTQKLPLTPYIQHDQGTTGSNVMYPSMFSDNADSRVDDLWFIPNGINYLGIYVGSKGYAYQDNISYFLQNIPVEVIENFRLYIQPILNHFKISDVGEVHICSQVW